MIWHGCSRPAWLAAFIASYWSFSSVITTRFSTTLVVRPPICWLALASALRTALAVVSVSSVRIGYLAEVTSRRHDRPSRAIMASALAGPADPAG